MREDTDESKLFLEDNGCILPDSSQISIQFILTLSQVKH